jgi:hypothetical protein
VTITVAASANDHPVALDTVTFSLTAGSIAAYQDICDATFLGLPEIAEDLVAYAACEVGNIELSRYGAMTRSAWEPPTADPA